MHETPESIPRYQTPVTTSPTTTRADSAPSAVTIVPIRNSIRQVSAITAGRRRRSRCLRGAPQLMRSRLTDARIKSSTSSRLTSVGSLVRIMEKTSAISEPTSHRNKPSLSPWTPNCNSMSVSARPRQPQDAGALNHIRLAAKQVAIQSLEVSVFDARSHKIPHSLRTAQTPTGLRFPRKL